MKVPVAPVVCALAWIPGMALEPEMPLGIGRNTPAESHSGSGHNLAPNGDFEKGKGVGPDDWQRPDELTTFWVRRPTGRGRCIRINTDVLASQFRARQDEIAEALEAGKEPPPPPRRKPTREPKYDTVAGLDGVHYSSDHIPIDPGAFYQLEVDVKVDRKASPKVWIKAYARIESRAGARDRVVWKKSLNCEGSGRDWKTFRMVFPDTTRFPSRVERIRIQLYPCWPAATYHFDNVRLFEIDEEQVRAFQAETGLLPRKDEARGEKKRERAPRESSSEGRRRP